MACVCLVSVVGRCLLRGLALSLSQAARVLHARVLRSLVDAHARVRRGGGVLALGLA